MLGDATVVTGRFFFLKRQEQPLKWAGKSDARKTHGKMKKYRKGIHTEKCKQGETVWQN